jgi:carnitine O-acetyltransferase
MSGVKSPLLTNPGPVDPKWVSKLELVNAIPRLPIPPLQTTLSRYLQIVRPLVSEKQYSETCNKVAEFGATEGVRLDALLHELSTQAPTSWLEGFWDTMYLEYREPSPINVNPAFVWNDDPSISRNSNNAQLLRATKLIAATAVFVANLRAGRLAPDTLPGNPTPTSLCMTQYSKLFGACRIPRPGRDEVVVKHDSRHVVVLARDNFYKMDVINEYNTILPIETIYSQLASILEHARTRKTELSDAFVGILTSDHRDVWAEVYPSLHSSNKVSMEAIETSIVALCLDPPSPSNDDIDGICLATLHNRGHNRYFDKSIQLIVFGDGRAAINMEHSAYDGHTLIRFAGDVYTHSLTIDTPSAEKLRNVAGSFEALTWKLTPAIRRAISLSQLKFDKFVATMDSKALLFDKFGADTISKKAKMSPDAFVQMAFQITYWSLTGALGNTYESVQTKRYYHGRTECLRSLSQEVVHMILSGDGTADQQIKFIRAAATAHVEQAKRCQVGEGVDRHLWGMLQLAKQLRVRLAGYQIPSIFNDVAWSRMRTDEMSTSNCGNPTLTLFAFGPVVPQGFGLGYIIKKDRILLNVTSFQGLSAKYAEIFEHTLQQMRELFEHNTPMRYLSSPFQPLKAKL